MTDRLREIKDREPEVKQFAKDLASLANECCYRSDGWEKQLEETAFRYFNAVRADIPWLIAEVEMRDRAIRHFKDTITNISGYQKIQSAEVERLSAALDRAKEGLEFYAEGRIDHEPDRQAIVFNEPMRFTEPLRYGHIARETLTDIQNLEAGE